jgi:serine/threonine protein kinase
MLNLIGQTLDGKYAIERELGRGGMGTVYFANHIGTERPVAVKVISPQFMAKNEFVERFRREARAAGRLRHPNVVDVTDFGIAETKDGSVAYLVMEYLDGCTLGEILEEEKRLPLTWSLDILEQVCSAVNEAHHQGIIHRDLKPDNIWLEPNQRGGYTVKVLDFGIAKLEEHMVDNARRQISPTSSTGTGAFRQQSTVVDQERPSGTMLMEQNSTTAINTAFNDESGTQMSEAGTLVKHPEAEARAEADAEVDLESGTAIMPGAQNPQTQTFAGEGDKTQLMSAVPVESEKLEGKTSAIGASAELTRVGAVLGTPLYMSPEQCRGEKLDQRSDIYSLGIITYQMLGGDTPFTGNYSEVMQAHKDTAVPPLQARKVSRRVKKTVMSALAKDPEQRPQTAEAFASILRAHSEGMGALLKKAISIYGEHLPKFFLFSFIIGSPFIFLTFLKVALQLLGLYYVIDSTFSDWAVATIAIVNFFVQIFFGAVVVGATTWIVAQILAMPLRPISVRAAAQEVRKRWKPLIIAVTLNTLMVSVGIVLCFIPGIWLTTRNMLVAPAIIMEGISWRESFRRSKALVSRSYWTVLGTVLVLHVIPIFFAMIISLSIMAMVRTGVDAYEKKAGVVKPAPQENKDIGIKIKPNGVSIAEAEIDPEVAEQMGKSYLQKTAGIVSQGIFEMIWAPIVIFITSFISVITALVYFKTRQAGGESMQDLLKQFEAGDRPRRKWQERIRHRLVVSGRSASKSTSKSTSKP